MAAPRSISISFSFFSLSAGALLLTFAVLLSGCATISSHPSASQPTQPSQPTPSTQPDLALSATSFNFNTVAVGQSATQTLQIANTGNAPLTINSLLLSSQQFSFTGPSIPRTVLPSQNVVYSISFAPTSAGNLSASIQISSNASSAPAVIALAGVAESAFAALQVSPSSVNFGSLQIQNTSTQTVSLKNTGDMGITISGVTLAGAGFGFSNLSPGVSLSPNQTISFQIWFRPSVAGSATGTLSILSANIASPASIPLSGDGMSGTSPPSTPPAASTHSVSLSWAPSGSSSITGYRVYRSTNSDTDFLPLTLPITALSYTDDTVVNGTTYYYVVTAVDSAGVESSYSNQVIAAIPSS